jgi:hypothetical protein
VFWLRFVCSAYGLCVLVTGCVFWLWFVCSGYGLCVLVTVCVFWLRFVCSAYGLCVLVTGCVFWLWFVCSRLDFKLCFLLLTPPVQMELTECSKTCHIKFRRRGITQKREYSSVLGLFPPVL